MFRHIKEYHVRLKARGKNVQLFHYLMYRLDTDYPFTIDETSSRWVNKHKLCSTCRGRLWTVPRLYPTGKAQTLLSILAKRIGVNISVRLLENCRGSFD